MFLNWFKFVYEPTKFSCGPALVHGPAFGKCRSIAYRCFRVKNKHNLQVGIVIQFEFIPMYLKLEKPQNSCFFSLKILG